MEIYKVTKTKFYNKINGNLHFLNSKLSKYDDKIIELFSIQIKNENYSIDMKIDEAKEFLKGFGERLKFILEGDKNEKS